MPSASPESSLATLPRVLVVDDDEGLLILMADALASEGYTVDTATSGNEALERLWLERPDLMVLDLKLRDLGGAELIDRLRAVDDTIPFIVVTGQGDERVAVQIMKQGALDYVMKDSALFDLLPTVVARAMTAITQERALAEARRERRRLERSVLEISEREQYRIGADLHDGLGQQLTAIEMMCASLKLDLADRQPDLVPSLERVAAMLREAIKQTRSMARGLVPVKDEPEALWVSLVELAELTNGLGRARCRFDCPIPILLEDNRVAGHLYRIAQEAVNNAVKHSKARSIELSLRRTADAGLELRIADDGAGLSADRHAGLGLQVMRHRAEVIGATLTLTSDPSEGLTITCTLPPDA